MKQTLLLATFLLATLQSEAGWLGGQGVNTKPYQKDQQTDSSESTTKNKVYSNPLYLACQNYFSQFWHYGFRSSGPFRSFYSEKNSKKTMILCQKAAEQKADIYEPNNASCIADKIRSYFVFVNRGEDFKEIKKNSTKKILAAVATCLHIDQKK